MLLSELIDLVFVESGQFILDNLEDFSLNKEKFWLLTKSQLQFYEKYRPFTWSETVDMSGKYTFVTEVDDDQLPEADQKVVKAIPKWVSSVIPVDTFAVPSVGVLYKSLGMGSHVGSDKPPSNWIWRYEKPSIIAPFTGKVDVRCHGAHIFHKDISTSSALRDVEVVDFDMDPDFVQLVTGKFLQAIGRSRRAFTLTDIPVSIDSDSLVSEGKELEETAKENIINRAAFHLAIGN